MKRTVLIAMLAVIASAIFAGGGILVADSPVHAAMVDIEPTATQPPADAVHDGLPTQWLPSSDCVGEVIATGLSCGVAGAAAGGVAGALGGNPVVAAGVGIVTATACAVGLEVAPSLPSYSLPPGVASRQTSAGREVRGGMFTAADRLSNTFYVESTGIYY